MHQLTKNIGSLIYLAIFPTLNSKKRRILNTEWILFFLDEAEESDEDLAVLDEDDYDWKPSAAGLSAKKAQMMASKRVSKRGRKPKKMQEIYVPKMKSEIKEERTEFDHVPIVEGQGNFCD